MKSRIVDLFYYFFKFRRLCSFQIFWNLLNEDQIVEKLSLNTILKIYISLISLEKIWTVYIIHKSEDFIDCKQI